MKIPSHVHIYDSNPVVTGWKNAAERASIEGGIFVEVVVKYRGVGFPSSHVDEILFKIMDHEFGSLRELKKAIGNKAFL